MKKTLIALFALTGVVAAETVSLSSDAKTNGNASPGKVDANYNTTHHTDYPIDTPFYSVDTENSVASLIGGNICLTWGGTNADAMLTSWKLSFTLTDESIITDTVNAETGEVTKNYSHLFGTLTKGAGAAGYTLKVNSDGALVFSDITTDAGTIQAGVATDITLSFIANEKLGNLTGGTFTLTVGEDSWSKIVSFETSDATFDPLTNYSTSILNGVKTRSYTDDNGVTKNQNYSTNLWTNGGAETFSNIKLEKLSNNILPVPEPTTATLSLLALAALAARRRRK